MRGPARPAGSRLGREQDALQRRPVPPHMLIRMALQTLTCARAAGAILFLSPDTAALGPGAAAAASGPGAP